MSSGPSGASVLDQLAGALRSAPGWQASFEQRYLPAGFSQGSSEQGTVVLAPPLRLRFDYAGAAPRVFAVDGAVARLVDPGTGSCDAVRVDGTTWSRLPLAAILDPGATRQAFTVSERGRTITMVPRESIPELAELTVEVGGDGLPTAVAVTDGSGNRNEFIFARWRRREAPPDAFFHPGLPGQTPCVPDQG